MSMILSLHYYPHAAFSTLLFPFYWVHPSFLTILSPHYQPHAPLHMPNDPILPISHYCSHATTSFDLKTKNAKHISERNFFLKMDHHKNNIATLGAIKQKMWNQTFFLRTEQIMPFQGFCHSNIPMLPFLYYHSHATIHALPLPSYNPNTTIPMVPS